MLVTGPVQFDFVILLAFIVTVQFNQHYTVKLATLARLKNIPLNTGS